MTNNYQRDGHMSINRNGEDSPNYFPNSFDDIVVDESFPNNLPCNWMIMWLIGSIEIMQEIMTIILNREFYSKKVDRRIRDVKTRCPILLVL